MDLQDLTNDQLRFEFRRTVQNYIYLISLPDIDHSTKMKATVLKNEVIGEILAELRYRREVNR